MQNSNKKILNLIITDYTFTTLEELYNKETYNILTSTKKVQTSKIYSIIRTDKLFFDIDTILINSNYDISCDIIIKDKKTNIKFNLLEYYFDLFGKEFNDVSSFKTTLNKALEESSFCNNNNLKKETLYEKIIFSINESNDNLDIKCPVHAFLSHGKFNTSSINIYKLLNFFNIDIVNELDILYIGQSMKDTMHRLKEHNKWGQIFAEDRQCISNNNYLIYVFNFEQVNRNITHIDTSNVLIRNTEAKLNSCDIINTLEVALISHYKPIINNHFINTNLKDIDFISRKLKLLGYTNLLIEMILEESSVMGNIKTSNVSKQAIEIEIEIN